MADSALRRKLQNDLVSSPFNAYCGFRVDEADKDAGRLTLRLPTREEHLRLAGSNQYHGGPIAALVDTAGCFACVMMLGYGVPTVNFRVDYLRPAAGDWLRATATLRKTGRSIAVVDIDVLDDRDRLVAVGRGTYSTQAG